MLSKRAAADLVLHALDNRISGNDEELQMMVMRELSRLEDWPTFWKTWRSFPARQLARTQNLCAAMYQILAATGSQTMCIEALNTWLPEMQHERPPVQLPG